jgi:hypothetical protein
MSKASFSTASAPHSEPGTDLEEQNDQIHLTQTPKEVLKLIVISKTIDLLRADSPPLIPMLSALVISCLQFMTYIAILSDNKNGVDPSQNQFFIIITIIFASFAITNAGLPLLIELVTSSVPVLHNVWKCRQCEPLKLFLISFEFLNFILLTMAAMIIVPAQGKPLDIVLNCTALLIIAELDDGYFRCFPCEAKVVDEEDTMEKVSYVEGAMTMTVTKKMMYGLGLSANFIVILVMYSIYYVNAIHY